MPHTVREAPGSAGVVMVARWCVSRGERVTVFVPEGCTAAELSSHFTGDELASITFAPSPAVRRGTAATS